MGGVTQVGITKEEKIPIDVILPKTVAMQKYSTNEEKMAKSVAMSVVLTMPNRRKKLRYMIPLFIFHAESPNIRPLPSQYHHQYGATHALQL
jgi:hypothetical protein